AAVPVKPPLGQFIDDLRRTGRKPDDVAVDARHGLGHADLAAEGSMLGKVQRLAVDRHQNARPDPAIEFLKLGAARVAGDVDKAGAVGDDLDALADQAIDDTAHSLFISRNG